MLEGLIGLIIGLAIVAVVYIIVRWLLGLFPIPTPLSTVVQIVFAVIAVVLVLRYLAGFVS